MIAIIVLNLVPCVFAKKNISKTNNQHVNHVIFLAPLATNRVVVSPVRSQGNMLWVNVTARTHITRQVFMNARSAINHVHSAATVQPPIANPVLLTELNQQTYVPAMMATTRTSSKLCASVFAIN
jgi:hypothetical protein